MRMTEIAEARLRRTATSYCNIDSLAKGQWPPIGEEGVFTRVRLMPNTTVFLLDIIDSNSSTYTNNRNTERARKARNTAELSTKDA